MNVLHHEINILGGISRERFADLKLVTECDQSLSVHKVVLAAASSKICDILASKDVNVIPVRNTKFTALNHIVDFIYERKVIFMNSGELEDFKDAYILLEVNLGSKINDMIKGVGHNTTGVGNTSTGVGNNTTTE